MAQNLALGTKMTEVGIDSIRKLRVRDTRTKVAPDMIEVHLTRLFPWPCSDSSRLETDRGAPRSHRRDRIALAQGPRSRERCHGRHRPQDIFLLEIGQRDIAGLAELLFAGRSQRRRCHGFPRRNPSRSSRPGSPRRSQYRDCHAPACVPRSKLWAWLWSGS